jgi:hypothetical protein
MSPKFEQLGGRKNKNVLNCGLLVNNEYFWHGFVEKFQGGNQEYDNLAYTGSMFVGVNPSVKLKHNWHKLQEIYKGLTKSNGEIFESFKKSGNHDDFINFCGAKSEVYYLYFWLKEKPQLDAMIVTELPDEVFFDSGMKEDYEVKCRPSLTCLELSFASSGGSRNSLVASMNALVEERWKSQEPAQYDSAINKQKLDRHISHNYDENVKRLIDVKHQLETETNSGIIKVLKKYKKKLTMVVDFSSSSDSEN